jgi:hypothetical protein
VLVADRLRQSFGNADIGSSIWRQRRTALLERATDGMAAVLIRIFLAFSAFLLLVCIAPGAPKPNEPKQCPVPGYDLEAIEAALQKAASCEESKDTFEACSRESGADIRLGTAVISRCEGDFLNKLNASQKRAYKQKRNRCRHKYQREAGTMYRSFEVKCEASVAQSYSRRFLSASETKKRK